MDCFSISNSSNWVNSDKSKAPIKSSIGKKKVLGIPTLQGSADKVIEEIRRAIREKLNRFTFPCPHCREHIKDEDFGKEQQAFHYISEMEFPEVKGLKETIKNHEQKIIHLQSPDYIENSIRVKKLEEEKKEIAKNLQNQNQELQKQLTEKKEQIQNLVLRQKGQGAGVNVFMRDLTNSAGLLPGETMED
ncbi:12914_t:CDS:2 [Entrophospora sp. SA101]|nr:12914_t:CDS:2 [Entrophospora sp. SA101]